MFIFGLPFFASLLSKLLGYETKVRPFSNHSENLNMDIKMKNIIKGSADLPLQNSLVETSTLRAIDNNSFEYFTQTCRYTFFLKKHTPDMPIYLNIEKLANGGKRLFRGDVKLGCSISCAKVAKIVTVNSSDYVGKVVVEDLNNIYSSVLKALSTPHTCEDETTSDGAVMDILHNDPIGYIREALDKLIVGEEDNKFLVYLTMTSRLLDKPLALHFISASGSGKSTVLDGVLATMPPEGVLKGASFSPKNLFRQENLQNMILYSAEQSGMKEAKEAFKLFQSEGTLTQHTVHGGRIQENVTVGPIALVSSSTYDIDPELMSRVIPLSIDESKYQTQKVVESVFEAASYEGILRKKEKEQICKQMQDLQRALQPVLVVNDWAKYINVTAVNMQMRRIANKIVTIANTLALINQFSKARKYFPDGTEYIECSLEEMNMAIRLANTFLKNEIGSISVKTRNLYEHIKELVSGDKKNEFSRKNIATVSGCPVNKLKPMLDELLAMDYIKKLDTRAHNKFWYKVNTQVAAELIIDEIMGDKAVYEDEGMPQVNNSDIGIAEEGLEIGCTDTSTQFKFKDIGTNLQPYPSVEAVIYSIPEINDLSSDCAILTSQLSDHAIKLLKCFQSASLRKGSQVLTVKDLLMATSHSKMMIIPILKELVDTGRLIQVKNGKIMKRAYRLNIDTNVMKEVA